MKVLKRNQIIILVIALMLVSAGYLNYTATTGENTIQTSIEDKIDYAGIGDAKLVNANAVEETNLAGALVDNNEAEENTIVGSAEIQENTEETTANVTDEYFSSSRLTRETMYSQMIETYQKILENESIPVDQKTIAQTEIKNINDIKNKIMICENLIKTKGIDDVVIFVNDNSISVIVKSSDTLKEEQVAQIQNIIAREIQTELTNIHISNK